MWRLRKKQMKKLKQISFLVLTIMFVLTSCTMDKRLYSSGYHTEWNKSKHNSDKKDYASEKKEVQVEPNQTVLLGEPETQIKNDVNAIQNETISPSSIDNLTASNDNTIIVQSQKPVLLNIQANTINDKTNNTIESKILTDEKVNNVQKKKEKKSSARHGGKLQLVALILCIFLGLIGVHRFYLGYTGLGILYLFTFGLCGIGWLIDLILLIIPGGLTPKGKTSYRE